MELRSRLVDLADSNGEAFGRRLGDVMPIINKLASRLASLSLAAGFAGCATPWDSFDRTRAIPQVAQAATRPNPGTRQLAQPSAPLEMVPASSQRAEVPPPQTLTADETVRFTLEHNPLLQAVREQRGVAQGSVVIARTYPYNPILQSVIAGVSGPRASDITNHTFNATTIRLDVEWRGQGTYRRSAASAVVTRTEWEIAVQEVNIAVTAVRAFNTIIYRRRKLDVLEDTVQYAEDVAALVKKLVEAGRLRPADLILARTELNAARAQLGQGRTALAVARADLRRQLGTTDDSFEVKGELDLPVPPDGLESFWQAARDQRPDLQARKTAVAEAQARYRLQVADRFGNPSVGPTYELNETNDSFLGISLAVPLPLLNTRQGEILQAKAMLARALADVNQFEVQSSQDVQAALVRLAEARKLADSYTAEVLPHLRQAVKDMNKLLEQNDPGVDIVRVLGVQRNYLRAFDAYLDALFELSQARADLAAAVGDPTLALGRPRPREQLPTKLDPAPPKDMP